MPISQRNRETEKSDIRTRQCVGSKIYKERCFSMDIREVKIGRENIYRLQDRIARLADQMNIDKMVEYSETIKNLSIAISILEKVERGKRG